MASASGGYPAAASPVKVPQWSADQSHALCVKGEESRFIGKANLLDEKRFKSIRATVEELNRTGDELAKEGFCIVFSENSSRYFLIYKRQKQKIAFELFNVEKPWSVQRSKQVGRHGEFDTYVGHDLPRLDQTNVTSLEQAVDLLSFPHDHDEPVAGVGDICIVTVEKTDSLHLLYSKNLPSHKLAEFDLPQTSKASSSPSGNKLTVPGSTPNPAGGASPTLTDADAPGLGRIASNTFWAMKDKVVSKLGGFFSCANDSTPTFDPKKLVATYPRGLTEKYEIVKQIGSGAQGVTHLVKLKTCPEGEGWLRVAKATHDLSRSGLEDFRTELARMQELRHPNCLKVLEVVEPASAKQLYIITEFAEGGDLYSYMNDMLADEEAEFSEDTVKEMMEGAMRGVAFLHDQKVVHNDLKPDNILVMGKYVPKKERPAGAECPKPRVVVADYGCATVEWEDDKIFFGDPRYMSPEAMTSMMAYLNTKQKIAKSGPEVDIWAMGVTIYQFLGKGILPFLYQKCTLPEVKGVFQQLKEKLTDTEEVIFQPGWAGSEKAQDLLRKMLQKQKDKRVNAQKVLDHAWFSSDLKSNKCQGISEQIQFETTRNKVCALLRGAVATKLRYEHVEKSYEIFKQFDPDNSGSIDEEEFIKACKKIAPNKTKEQVAEYFKRADVDGDGRLEFSEFSAITLNWDTLSSGELDQYLGDIFATVGDGMPTHKFELLLQELLGKVDGLHEAVGMMDANKDGTIQIEELIQFIQKGAAYATDYNERPGKRGGAASMILTDTSGLEELRQHNLEEKQRKFSTFG